jgi:Rieske Fe-S protein
MKRREVLAVVTGTAAAGAALLPLAAAVTEPLRVSEPPAPWLDVASEREVLAGVPLKAELLAPVRDGFFTTLSEAGAVWLQRRPGSGLLALSAACPHLGCLVGLSAGGFACPCHQSRFGLDGACLGGPAPRGLDPLPVRIENGRVLVQALRFAPAIAARRSL